MPCRRSAPALLSWIETRADALRAVREGSFCFFLVAAFLGGLGIFLDPAMLPDAALFGALAAVLRRWNLRTAAVLLLILSSVIFVVTTLNHMGITAEGGTNSMLAIAVLGVSVRVVEATFKLRGRFKKTGGVPSDAARAA